MTSFLHSVRGAFLLAALFAFLFNVSLALPQADGTPKDFKSLTKAEIIHSAEVGDLEIVPGPGLPSLESLNLTSRDLVVRAFDRMEQMRESNNDSLEKRYTATCDNVLMHGEGGWFCFEYLLSLGQANCIVPPWGARFCHTNYNVYVYEVAWYGATNGLGPNDWTQSKCHEVANAGIWILHNCHTPYGGAQMQFGGTDAPWNNQNLVVRIGLKDWWDSKLGF
ncbi:hypothetical protein CC2G_013476 [Coprinopsis cinerea AmutBmut pab1-1]|nr:hypothetical protein CC2G_013476 [Coprinopsis cinerea AmutBmut pab1-1]